MCDDNYDDSTDSSGKFRGSNQEQLNKTPEIVAIDTRRAIRKDAEEIVGIFLESAAFHAELDPERYLVPVRETISARYRERLQDSLEEGGRKIVLVTELNDELVGFIEARLERSSDAMHREMAFCHISEIAVRNAYRNKGIGGCLLQAAENWGRQRGAQFASLEFHVENKRAGSFYQKYEYRAPAITTIKRL